MSKMGKYHGNCCTTLTKRTCEKDCTLQANLRKAPRFNLKVLNPGNNKQSVPLALAIIHETTTAAIESHFHEKNNSNDFRRLLNIWCIISNSKTQFLSNNPLDNATKIGDNKPLFLRLFAAWVAKWQNEKIPCFETITLTKQTSSALIRTLLCLEFKSILDKIIKAIVSTTSVHQWKNTSDVIKWFKSILTKVCHLL